MVRVISLGKFVSMDISELGKHVPHVARTDLKGAGPIRPMPMATTAVRTEGE